VTATAKRLESKKMGLKSYAVKAAANTSRPVIGIMPVRKR
jgi:hypothetical protein